MKARSNGSVKHRRKSPPRDKVSLLLGRFGEYLSERREREKFTLREFARRARMAHSNVYQLERLRKDPRLSELQKLATAFRQPLKEFLRPLLQ